jgi:hypothetical protein
MTNSDPHTASVTANVAAGIAPRNASGTPREVRRSTSPEVGPVADIVLAVTVTAVTVWGCHSESNPSFDSRPFYHGNVIVPAPEWVYLLAAGLAREDSRGSPPTRALCSAKPKPLVLGQDPFNVEGIWRGVFDGSAMYTAN